MKKKCPWSLKYQCIKCHEKRNSQHNTQTLHTALPTASCPSLNLHLSSLYTLQKGIVWLHCYKMRFLVTVGLFQG